MIVLSMKKIRINELARELEVKAHEVLERLPELGVTEKKTHSSSIDEDVAIRLRRLYGQDVPDYVPEPEDAETEAHAEQQVEVREARQGRAAASPAAHSGGTATLVEEPPVKTGEKPATEEPAHTGPTAPIRPPLAGGRPVHPPVGTPGSRPQMPRVAPAQPSAAAPSAGMPTARATPAQHSAPPAPALAPSRPVARKPGQVLAGPRQPFPSAPSEARPGTPQDRPPQERPPQHRPPPQRPAMVPRMPQPSDAQRPP